MDDGTVDKIKFEHFAFEKKSSGSLTENA